jgi:hypothetical protein
MSVDTVTVQVAVRLPSSVVAVIVAVPVDTAVTTPLFTVATLVLLLVHDTFWLVALLGATVAVSDSVPPMASVVEVVLSDTPVTGIIIDVTDPNSFHMFADL